MEYDIFITKYLLENFSLSVKIFMMNIYSFILFSIPIANIRPALQDCNTGC